jgi:hypothetical protein
VPRLFRGLFPCPFQYILDFFLVTLLAHFVAARAEVSEQKAFRS